MLVKTIVIFLELVISPSEAKYDRPLSKMVNFVPRIPLLYNTYILLDVLVCSIAVYFYELCRILTSP